MIGAVPVPVYADAVADEIAAVLNHSEAAIIIAQDQEQIDKILSVRARLPRLAYLLYDEPRGMTRVCGSRPQGAGCDRREWPRRPRRPSGIQRPRPTDR